MWICKTIKRSFLDLEAAQNLRMAGYNVSRATATWTRTGVACAWLLQRRLNGDVDSSSNMGS
jgi:hypothetical protein